MVSMLPRLAGWKNRPSGMFSTGALMSEVETCPVAPPGGGGLVKSGSWVYQSGHVPARFSRLVPQKVAC